MVMAVSEAVGNIRIDTSTVGGLFGFHHFCTNIWRTVVLGDQFCNANVFGNNRRCVGWLPIQFLSLLSFLKNYDHCKKIIINDVLSLLLYFYIYIF